MANNTVKFDIKAAIDTRGLDEFQSQLGELRSTAEPLDRVLGQAVKSIKEWAEASRLSERNTAAATSAINALTSAMTAGGSEWKKGTQAANDLNRTLRETVNAANAAKAALAAPARATGIAGQQIADMRKGLQDLTIGSTQYLSLLQQITEREALVGRRTGRAGVVAANQAFEGALLTRGYGAPDRLQAMPDTTAALRQRLSELSEALPNLIRGQEDYLAAAREMRQIENELARDVSRSVSETNALTAARKRLADTTRLSAQSSRSGFAAFSSSIAGDLAVERSIRRSEEKRQRDFIRSLPEGATLSPGYAQPIGPEISPQSAAALNQQYQKLADALPLVARGGERYLQISREMRQIERDLARDMSRSTDETNALAAARKRLADATSLSRSSRGSGFAAWSGSVNDRLDTQNAIDQYRQQQGLPVGFRSGAAQFTQGQNTAQLGPAAPTELLGSIDGIRIADSTAKIQTLGRTYDQVAQQIRDTAQAAGGSTRALQAERQAWEQLQASVAPATREYKQAGREMQRLDRQLGTSTRGERFLESAGAISAGAFFGGPEGLAGGLLGMAVGGPGAALGGASIGAQLGIVRKSIGDAATYSAEIGKLRIALKGVVGDTEEYNKALGVVSSVSRSLNIPVQEATQGFTRLAAAVVGAGGNVGDAEVVFKGVTSAIKATGGSSQDAQSAVLALSQVFSKGKVSAEELQGQLGERLPGAVTLFAQATGRTLPQLSKDLEQGTVGLNDLMRFTELLSSKYAANALTIARSTEDSGARQALALSNLREEFGKTFMPLGAALQDGASSWAEYTASVLSNINKIIQRYEILKGVLNIGGTALLGATPVIGPLIAGMSIGGQRNQSPQGRLANAGSTTMYSDAQGNVYDTATGKLLLSGGRANTNFADPKSDKSDEEARKAAEREERKRQEEASRQQRLELQLNNDRVRLDEQRAENAIRLEDRIFQHRQELMRREREQQLQLDQLRQQRLLVNLTPEGRAAVAPLVDVLNRLRDLSGQRQTLRDQLEAAKQQERSAQRRSENTQRFNGAYREDSQSNNRISIGDQFISQLTGGQFEEVAGLQPLPLQRMYRQMGRQVQRWTDMVQNEAEYFLKKTYGSKKPLIPQEIIDSTIERVRIITDTIQSFDPLEVQFRELENSARGRSGNARSRLAAPSLEAIDAIFSEIRDEVRDTARRAANRAGSSFAELGGLTQDLSDFLTDGQHKILSDAIKQVSRDSLSRSFLETRFGIDFGTLFRESANTADPAQGRLKGGRGAAGGRDSLAPPDLQRSPSGGIDYLRQYREIQELMEPPRITPGVESQFDGASLGPLLKKFGSIAALGYIPVTIENPDVIAQATGRIVQHFHGDPSRPGYDRRGHGLESNAHDHFGFDSEATTRRVMQELRRRGYQVTRFGVRSGHLTNSLHYSNRAFDVPWSQFGSGPIGPNDFARSRRLRAEVEEILGLAPGATTTLANGREIRTPGAASAAMRAASAQGNLLEARASVGAVEKEFAALERDFPKFVDAITGLGIDQTLQSLREQELALRDNYKEWQIRNRMTQEGYKPEQIEFEVQRNKYLKDQERSITAINRVLEDQEPILQKLLKPEEYAKFMEMVAKTKSEIQNQTNNVVNAQAALVQAQLDPYNQWRNKIVELNKSLRDFNDIQKLAMDMSGQFSSNLANGFSTAASSIITGNGSIQQSFADLFNNIAKMFIDTIARVLADQATSFLLDLLKPAVSSIAPGPVAVANNIVPRAGFMGPGFATGGVSSGPTSGYPVTLHGTEAIVPLPNGRAIPVEMKGSGGTNVVVNVNMTTGETNVSSSEGDGRLLGTAISDAVQAELIRQQRPGGILYRR